MMKHRLVSLSFTALFSSTNQFANAFSLKPKFASCSGLHPPTRRMMTSVDPEYPGTAVERMNNVRARVVSLSEGDLSGDWPDVRRKLLWAGGLRDLETAVPGKGYTGHSFNDYNHVDLTTMADNTSDNLNDGEVRIYASMKRMEWNQSIILSFISHLIFCLRWNKGQRNSSWQFSRRGNPNCLTS